MHAHMRVCCFGPGHELYERVKCKGVELFVPGYYARAVHGPGSHTVRKHRPDAAVFIDPNVDRLVAVGADISIHGSNLLLGSHKPSPCATAVGCKEDPNSEFRIPNSSDLTKAQTILPTSPFSRPSSYPSPPAPRSQTACPVAGSSAPPAARTPSWQLPAQGRTRSPPS